MQFADMGTADEMTTFNLAVAAATIGLAEEADAAAQVGRLTKDDQMTFMLLVFLVWQTRWV